MEIILLENILNLGNIGDKVKYIPFSSFDL